MMMLKQEFLRVLCLGIARRSPPRFPRTAATPHRPAASSTRLLSTFRAPEPPRSKGQAVFVDIDFSADGDNKPESARRNSDPRAVFVVTGASRGIGLQFVKSLVARTEGAVVALCRSPDSAASLRGALSAMTDDEKMRVTVWKLDLEDQGSIESACETIKQSFDRVDLLLNVAGILGDGKTTPGPERSIQRIDREWLARSLDVNLLGPTMLSQGLLPLMEQQRNSATRRPKSVIVNLSARVGSISDNGLGGWFSYRVSKSALNQATRTMAHELKGKSVRTIALHPGTTDTDLSKPFQRNVSEDRLFPVDFTVDKLLSVIDAMEDENSGGLYDWAGKAIPF